MESISLLHIFLLFFRGSSPTGSYCSFLMLKLDIHFNCSDGSSTIKTYVSSTIFRPTAILLYIFSRGLNQMQGTGPTLSGAEKSSKHRRRRGARRPDAPRFRPGPGAGAAVLQRPLAAPGRGDG